jgi:hypothetical protein
VDVIAYGMDGVLIRAYIAGLNTGRGDTGILPSVNR